MLLGAFIFVLIYGPYVLDPFYDGWIFMTGERDLPQHYLGFCAYRSSPWQFPLGLVTTASYPHDMSVIYTDAIPLLAFIFKLLNPLLPEVFQYLGIYGMLSMALTGGMGGLIIYEHTRQVKTSILASLFYTLSWVLVYRMFYHTSLTSHYLILLAFYIWIRLKDETPTLKCSIVYILLSGTVMLIHPYLWVMCGGIIAMSLIERLICDRDVKHFLICGAAYCITGALCLYVFGAFTGGTGMSLGVGSYEANLNTFFNSMGYGLLPGLPVALLQYEGFGYLGAGVLFMMISAFLLLLIRQIVPHMNLHRKVLLVTAVCFFLFSIIPEISLGEHVLLEFTPGRVGRTLIGMVRSNGRFIWPVCYMMVTATIVFILRHTAVRQRAGIVLLVICLALQIADMMPYLVTKHGLFAVGDYEYKGILDDNAALDATIDSYDHIVMDIKDGEVDQYLTYYAYLHGMTTNDFYYARPIESKVQNTLESLREDMKKGVYDESLLYVIGKDQLPMYEDFELNFYEIKGRYLASHRPIRGLEPQR